MEVIACVRYIGAESKESIVILGRSEGREEERNGCEMEWIDCLGCLYMNGIIEGIGILPMNQLEMKIDNLGKSFHGAVGR
jgi:hypothetical protein